MEHKEMEALLQSCQRELERLQAVNEIQKIMGRYEVVHNPLTMWRTPIDCFALTMPDVSMEVSDWGVWVGAEAVQYLFGTVMKEEPVGTMFIHTLGHPGHRGGGRRSDRKGHLALPGLRDSGRRAARPARFLVLGQL